MNLRERSITDPPWSPHIAGIVRHTGAKTLPIFFDGRNSHLFQTLGLFHPRLRTIMLPRELMNKRSAHVPVHVGKVIDAKNLLKLGSDERIVEFLRLKTYMLQNRSLQKQSTSQSIKNLLATRKKPRMLIPPLSPELLKCDIEKLPLGSKLIERNGYAVYVASSEQIPHVLQEIGRLREKTFREVGEGTGAPLDLDDFDRYYHHLFLWNLDVGEIVGGYRIGLADRLYKSGRKKALYTNTLFRLHDRFFDAVLPSLELGRSFICPHYQKKYNSLFLLWRGIGEFIVRNPHYKILFGPVSISDQQYNGISKDLMVRFFQNSRNDSELGRYVKPRQPVRSGKIKEIDAAWIRSSGFGIDDISALISEIELDGKGIPVLLRQYLKLNGVIIEFNRDKLFSNVIDGLLLVDLGKTEERLLRRFMGDEGFERFARIHGRDDDGHSKAGCSPVQQAQSAHLSPGLCEHKAFAPASSG